MSKFYGNHGYSPTPNPYQQYQASNASKFMSYNPSAEEYQHPHDAYLPPTPTQSSWQPNNAYYQPQKEYFDPSQCNYPPNLTQDVAPMNVDAFNKLMSSFLKLDKLLDNEKIEVGYSRPQRFYDLSIISMYGLKKFSLDLNREADEFIEMLKCDWQREAQERVFQENLAIRMTPQEKQMRLVVQAIPSIPSFKHPLPFTLAQPTAKEAPKFKILSFR